MRNVGCGTWNVKCGERNARCGMWNAENFLKIMRDKNTNITSKDLTTPTYRLTFPGTKFHAETYQLLIH